MDRVDEDYALIGLHVTFAGDVGVGSSYLPYAKAKLRDLIRGGETYQVKRYTPQTGVIVTVRVENEQRFVHIEAVTGCTDRPGFLLSRRAQAYDALYNDGELENINPVNGKPRPEPDLAKRTKGYKVPDELQRVGLDRGNSSKYSGMMRLAVACHHARSRESPFSYWHWLTHGIVKKTLRIANKDVDKYWVVEVREEGVFAAPIHNSGRCCDSWDVVSYMPRPKSAPGEPLKPRPKTLSLGLQFRNGDKRVQQIVSEAQMKGAYADGFPMYIGHGWAFSASGAECQAVLQHFIGIPPNHYLFSRWKITFKIVDDNLAATLTCLESKCKSTFYRHNIVWVPIGWGEWEGCWGMAPSVENPLTAIPFQNAPVAVYYVGEKEHVLRWTFSLTDEAVVSVPAVPATSTPQEPQFTCHSYALWGGDNFINGKDGYTRGVHQKLTKGFSCPAFNHVGDNFSRGLHTESFIVTHIPDGPIETYGNQYTIAPSCYYFDGQGNLVTACYSVFEEQGMDRIWSGWNVLDGTETRSNRSDVVLFAEEREAFMGVHTESESQSGSMHYNGLGSDYWCYHRRVDKVDAGPCPWINADTGGRGQPCNHNLPAPPPNTVDPGYQSGSTFAAAVLSLSDHFVDAAIPLGPEPWLTPLNYNLGTFLECDPLLKPYASSNVSAMHGNLHYPEEKLKPPDQRGNMVYLLDNKQIVLGGFDMPADPVAFVGKA